MVEITVLFFASLREKTGLREVQIHLENGATIRILKVALQDKYPELAPLMPTVVTAIDKEFAVDDEILFSGMEVAVFPPVSGGDVGRCAIDPPPGYRS